TNANSTVWAPFRRTCVRRGQTSSRSRRYNMARAPFWGRLDGIYDPRAAAREGFAARGEHLIGAVSHRACTGELGRPRVLRQPARKNSYRACNPALAQGVAHKSVTVK